MKSGYNPFSLALQLNYCRTVVKMSTKGGYPINYEKLSPVTNIAAFHELKLKFPVKELNCHSIQLLLAWFRYGVSQHISFNYPAYGLSCAPLTYHDQATPRPLVGFPDVSGQFKV